MSLCLGCLITNGQVSFTTQAFHQHTGICHFIGTTEEDKILEILDDSTLSISIYKSNYLDQYKTLRKLTYWSHFFRRGDTLFITYAGYTEVVKSENRTDTLKTPSIGAAVFYLPSIILISDEQATGIDKPLSLSKIAIEQVKLLHSRFQFWDKRVSSKNLVVFGLYD